ncbi:hypothetical protein JOE11_004307 [Robbsia andropogonis]
MPAIGGQARTDDANGMPARKCALDKIQRVA